MDRQNRLIEVYDYLRSRGLVHTKTDFASFLGFGRTSMAAALGGKESYLNDTFFRRICDVCPELSLDYLLTGVGSLLLGDPVADGADDRVRDLQERVAEQEELIATQRLLIETLRDRLRSLGVEYVAPSLPSRRPRPNAMDSEASFLPSRSPRPYPVPAAASSTFSLPAAEPGSEEPSPAPPPASGKSNESSGTAPHPGKSVSPQQNKTSDK